MKITKDTQPKQKKLHTKVFIIVGQILFFIIFFLCILISLSILWMFRTWAGLNINEFMFQIQSPVTGTDQDIIRSFIFSCLIASLVILGSVIFLHRIIKRDIVYLISFFLEIIVASLSIKYMWNRLDISEYIQNQSTYSDFIDDNYIDPKTTEIIFPENKRNLIYIFLESVENTYADVAHGGAFETNCIPELTDLSLENENFSGNHTLLNGGVALDGTTWTVGAMFGQTSGLPLLIPIAGNDMSTQKEFLPDIITLGDILEKEGYHQSLLIGSDASFGGRDLYFSQHGNYELLDYYYSKENHEIPDDYYVFWGYEDKKLFENAKKHLLEISQSDEPFNFTILTVDTHFEDGYICEDCLDTFGGNQYANVFACSSKKVCEFVAWVQQQDFYENTTIVISGDHPTMDSDFCINVDSNYSRKVYTTYINADAQVENNSYREYSTLDNFPTTLASLGVSIDGNRLGLGTNLFSEEPTLIEKYDIETINAELGKKSRLIDRLTSGIDVEAAPQENQNPVNEILFTVSDSKKGLYQVEVRNLENRDDIQSILCAVWAKEDQSDLLWYEAKLQEDNSYIAQVPASDFNYEQGDYNIHVYITNTNDEFVFLNGIIGNILTSDLKTEQNII